MIYKHDKPTDHNYRRDVVVILLLYGMIAFMLSTVYFAYHAYMKDGKIQRLERTISNEQLTGTTEVAR